jgi:hypothetical protein
LVGLVHGMVLVLWLFSYVIGVGLLGLEGCASSPDNREAVPCCSGLQSGFHRWGGPYYRIHTNTGIYIGGAEGS